MISGIKHIFSKESEKEKENKNIKLSSNLEKLKIATKIQTLLQEKSFDLFFSKFPTFIFLEIKSSNEENERRASELWWEQIYVPQEKIIENFYQDLQKVYYDQVVKNFYFKKIMDFLRP